MKVGVLLSNIEPTVGGGFTFQDDVLHALVKLETQHTFVVFSNLPKDQTTRVTGKQLQFVSLQRGFFWQARFGLSRIAARAVAKLPIIRNWFQIKYPSWLQRIGENLGIEVMWFVDPGYTEVDIPYVFTVWDLQHRLQPWFPEVSANGQWRGREKVYATAILRASTVIVGTEAGKAEIVHFYGIPPERVKLIPHPTPGFALSASKEGSKKILTKYHIPEGYLFYPAQFWPHKNHVGLLLALNLLRKKYGLILPLLFVGSDQGNLQYVDRMTDELGLSAQVHFLGFVPQEDLVGLYHSALALTYLTFFGPENLPPLEAFALGCPVIASNVSGALEQLGDAALLVDPTDEAQIARAVKSLYDDPALRQTLVQRGLERARKWTGEDYVKSVLPILDDFGPIRRCWSKAGS